MAPSTAWPTVRLADLIEVRHGFAFKGEYFSSEPGDVVLTPGNFEPSGGLVFRIDKDRSYTGPYPREFKLRPGDLLVVMTDLTQEARILGSAAFVPNYRGCLHNQRLGKVSITRPERLNQHFLYYFFNCPFFRKSVKATASGSTVKHTSPSRIADCRIALPPLDTQRRIAAILGAYDALMEVNRRRIAVLEEMVRRLFDEWFIHFRFPDHEGHEILETANGRVPKGWSKVALGSLCTETRDTVSPSELDSSSPYVGLEHIPRRSITLNSWGRADEVTSTKLKFKAGDILFGKIRPYFHKVVVAPFEGVCSSDAIVLRSARQNRAIVACVVSSDPFVAHAVATSNGTKMPRANWGVLSQTTVQIAPDVLMKRFSDTVLAWIELAASLNSANMKLAASRDLLLPRLISGDLSISDAESKLESAA